MTHGTPAPRTAPVLAVLVCHDGERWLGEALAALRAQRPAPRHVLAVDTGSRDGTAALLAAASAGVGGVPVAGAPSGVAPAAAAAVGVAGLLSGVLTLPRSTGFAEAVHAAVAHAEERWGDPGAWVWVLHDDSAPEPGCLSALLATAEIAPSSAVLGPLVVDWADPRVVVEAGLSTDASGRRQTGVGRGEPVGAFERTSEALAVGSAGALVRRSAWTGLGGYDRAFGLVGEDVDLGWRANLAGHSVLLVPAARLRHARALTTGERLLEPDGPGVGDGSEPPVGAGARGAVPARRRARSALRVTERTHGMRVLLINSGPTAFVLGLPRLTALSILRAAGLLLLRRLPDARAELTALHHLLTGRASLRAARAARPHRASLPGLLTSRTTRLRNTARATATHLVRRRVEADAALGKLPTPPTTAPPRAPEPEPEQQQQPEDLPRPVGPDALPAGALPRRRPVRTTGGLRKPATAVLLPIPNPATTLGSAPTLNAASTSGSSSALNAASAPDSAPALNAASAPGGAPAPNPASIPGPDPALTATSTPTPIPPLGTTPAPPTTSTPLPASAPTPAPGAARPSDTAPDAASAVSAAPPPDAASALVPLFVPALSSASVPPSTSVPPSASTPRPAPEAITPTPLRPSPVPRGTPLPPPLPRAVFVEVDRAAVLRSVLLGPPLLLALGLVLFALVANSGRLGLDLAGGRLLPVPALADLWSAYLSPWHPVSGGTTAPAPAALAVLGTAGALLGGPAAATALLLLGDAPLAGLAAYAATRRAPVPRPVRAFLAACYALLPASTAAVAQGRLDVVVVHVLLPPVLAGVAAVLRGGTGPAWLPVASGTALGLAALGAFSPLVHALVALAALIGFVAVPALVGDGRRRMAGLFAIVLLPMALLLPWPAVVVEHPVVLLHGVGAHQPTPPVSVTELLALTPGGDGALPWAGALLLPAALVAARLRPTRAMLPGAAAVVLAGFAAVALIAFPVTPMGGGDAHTGWTGAPLVLAGWGLVHVLLAACHRPTTAQPGLVAPPATRTGSPHAPRAGTPPVPHAEPPRAPRARLPKLLPATALVILLLVLVPAGVLGLRDGPLRADPVRLPSTLAAELPATNRSVLVLGEPTRQVAGRLPAFGDDDTPPTPSSPVRLARWTRDLTGGDQRRTRTALAQAAASGVSFVVPRDRAEADRMRAAAGDLLTTTPPLSDGRPVLRVLLTGGTALLLSPELARTARTGGDPPADQGTPGVVPVAADLPDAGARVSDGPAGRVLVLAAEEEPGWRATADGRPVPVLRAWGHLVAVPVPAQAADVRVEAPTLLRELLLLTQAAAVLVTLLTALPTRRR
ncbi:glycosyltransferase [Actinosynnema pretiosum]|uniref:Glycosyltransferase n=1 Tax=Actinosynnema pretiosum TaxID=42197 RepID=A0A290ZE06_9PSEU|nr:glycosyltransferase [Actinosynnema pretiosum]